MFLLLCFSHWNHRLTHVVHIVVYIITAAGCPAFLCEKVCNAVLEFSLQLCVVIVDFVANVEERAVCYVILFLIFAVTVTLFIVPLPLNLLNMNGRTMTISVLIKVIQLAVMVSMAVVCSLLFFHWVSNNRKQTTQRTAQFVNDTEQTSTPY